MGSDQIHNFSADEVISKLKDDGDFDRLRLKITRLLKQNEDMRNNIISVIKQSEALNCAGAERMKPRQLCDAIHDEVREQVMNQISDSLWEIIRSGDGMKNEIAETVQGVYNKLLNPTGKAVEESPCSSGQVPVTKGAEDNSSVMVSGESNGTLSDGEHKETPGLSQHNHSGSNHESAQSEIQQPSPSGRSLEQEKEFQHSNGSLATYDGKHKATRGSSSRGKRKQPLDGSDEDPDIPPGFG